MQKGIRRNEKSIETNRTSFFCEHGIAPEKGVQKVQDLINPIWKEVAGGCNLNRNIPQIIKIAVLKILN
jgi:hypothetical protein